MKIKTKISDLKEGDTIFLFDDKAESGTKCVHRIECFDGRLCFQPIYQCYWLDEYENNMKHKKDSRMDIMCGWEGYGSDEIDKIWKGDSFYKDRARIKKYLQKFL